MVNILYNIWNYNWNWLNNLENRNSNNFRNEDTSNPRKIFNKQNNHKKNNSEKIIDNLRLNNISQKKIKTSDFINIK